MIEVPINKIISLDESISDIAKIMKEASEEKSLYVVTKDGKPYVAIIDINYLEHLPEIKDAGETKPIQEIGKKGEPEKDSAEKQPEKQPEEETKTPTDGKNTEVPQVENTEDKESNDLYDENIGPWKKQEEEKIENDKLGTEPPDLPLG